MAKTKARKVNRSLSRSDCRKEEAVGSKGNAVYDGRRIRQGALLTWGGQSSQTPGGRG